MHIYEHTCIQIQIEEADDLIVFSIKKYFMLVGEQLS